MDLWCPWDPKDLLVSWGAGTWGLSNFSNNKPGADTGCWRFEKTEVSKRCFVNIEALLLNHISTHWILRHLAGNTCIRHSKTRNFTTPFKSSKFYYILTLSYLIFFGMKCEIWDTENSFSCMPQDSGCFQPKHMATVWVVSWTGWIFVVCFGLGFVFVVFF